MKIAGHMQLESQDHSMFRSATMRLAYLAQDRIELQHGVKEVARAMQAPTMRALDALKRMARYLIHAPRRAWR